MRSWKVLIFTLVLAAAYAGILQSEQEPVRGNRTLDIDFFGLYKNREATAPLGKDKFSDAPLLSTWSKIIEADDIKEADNQDLSKFLPVGSNYVNGDYKINELYNGDETTELPDEEPLPSAAPLSNMILSKLWKLCYTVVAIITFKSF